jgi:hypothetical protein
MPEVDFYITAALLLILVGLVVATIYQHRKR